MATSGNTPDGDGMRCPLCGGGNACRVAQGGDGADCWCFREHFPEQFLAQLPDEERGKACFCAGCLQRFREQKEQG